MTPMITNRYGPSLFTGPQALAIPNNRYFLERPFVLTFALINQRGKHMGFLKFNLALFSLFRSREKKTPGEMPVHSYSIIECLTDNEGVPQAQLLPGLNHFPTYFAFTNQKAVNDYQHSIKELSLISTRPWSLNALCETLKAAKCPSFVVIDPLFEGDDLTFQTTIVAPIFDDLTQKYLLSDPQDAMALLAIDPNDEKRLSVHCVFYVITNRSLPDDVEERSMALQEKIEELSFLAPRTPIAKGSGSFIATILNLDHLMEETAFIRNYKTLDHYSDIIFVTSDLTIKSGELESIPYSGDAIDTVLVPLIQWQRSRASKAINSLS